MVRSGGVMYVTARRGFRSYPMTCRPMRMHFESECVDGKASPGEAELTG